MARTYLINRKRYTYINVDSVSVTSYLISESDYSKWLKLDTTTDSIDVQLPANISEGFSCIIENTGIFTVNYQNEVGTSLATQQDPFTEDQYRAVEVAFNNGEWRVQGYVGRNDISSLYDVNTTANGNPADQDALLYNINTGNWQAGKVPPLIPRSPINLDYIIQESDHAKIIPVNTTAAPVDIAINTGLSEGFYCRIQNVGTGNLTLTPSVNWNSAVNNIQTQYSYVDIFHSSLEQYYVVSNESINVALTTGAPSSSPLTGTTKFDSGTNTLYIYNGVNWVSTVLT